MTKKLLRRDILFVFTTTVVLLLTVVAIVALQSRSAVKAPAQNNSIVITGTALCLPHKDTSGPQTMECALGIKDDDGRYYALSDTDGGYKNVSTLGIGKKVHVSGTFERSSSEIYPTEGTIRVSSIEQN